MALIEVKNLTKSYENDGVATSVLYGLNFKIEKGEFVAIMGPSGSGKSTLMHILGFLDKLTAGSYIFEGKDVSGLTDDELAEMRSNQVGFVFQAFNLLPRTTVLENVMLPLTYVKMDQAERIKKSKEALIAVGLEHRLNHFSNQLSGGEKQRVAIARSLVNNPAVIFADEPTGNLDSKSGLQVMRILQSLNEAGRTIILVTHEKYTADHARRILRVKDGLIIEDVEVAKRLFAKDGEELMK
ncbi:MAG: macrolide ABC transporter ATP-binding protein [Candidatus Magasanikbacteria bacterium RIFOXYD2_FULL_39_9]|uniref:Macrolide ABC transporter ATP-binding protein n=1 Tax=Candidatus Magasanikbacteria bacterium RIFOXYD1_FULL_40_23 TaxID=1798705 RepID=A0A1F6PA34_9BACT|nr:MAG: macrolide ABC transporter ATP-binding protein [Candidatus Magasanikbacteria bacterium RIFOXYD2_FULL_39_9]OGH92900.1 MAG: macrolide ABC transporter ATP-binding protein [Candidatus Magasanikbacteria bacterium RIFOXYD1_FULL_40_23]